MKTIYTKPQTQIVDLPGGGLMDIVRTSTCDGDCSEDAICVDDNGALAKQVLPDAGFSGYSAWSAWDDSDEESATFADSL